MQFPFNYLNYLSIFSTLLHIIGPNILFTLDRLKSNLPTKLNSLAIVLSKLQSSIVEMAKRSTPLWVTAALILVILVAGMAVFWNKPNSG